MGVQSENRGCFTDMLDGFRAQARATGFLGALPSPKEVSLCLVTHAGVTLIIGRVGGSFYADGAVSQHLSTRYNHKDAGAFPRTACIANAGVTAIVCDLGGTLFAWLTDVFAAKPTLVWSARTDIAVVVCLFGLPRFTFCRTFIGTAGPCAVFCTGAAVAPGGGIFSLSKHAFGGAG